MAKFDVQQWTEFIKKHKNPLLVAGDGCDRIELDGKKLSEFAASIAAKLGCPVAATGNTILSLKNESGINVKKMWLAELFRYLEGKWSEPLVEERPDLLLLIGYHPDLLEGMVGNARRIKTLHLGPGKLNAANRSMNEVTLKEWKANLEELVNAL